jgi:hypothetical protein
LQDGGQALAWSSVVVSTCIVLRGILGELNSLGTTAGLRRSPGNNKPICVGSTLFFEGRIVDQYSPTKLGGTE